MPAARLGARTPSMSHHLRVPAPVPGFPARFPVRGDGRRPLRYRLAAGSVRIGLRLLFLGRLHLEGADGVPLEGPLLVASNHISNWDPLILGAFFPGTLFAMAKRELFRPAPVAWLMLPPLASVLTVKVPVVTFTLPNEIAPLLMTTELPPAPAPPAVRATGTVLLIELPAARFSHTRPAGALKVAAV